MKVYSFWDPHSFGEQAELLRLWERSWQQHGWEPRLLTRLNANNSSKFTPSENCLDLMIYALHSVGGGWLSSPSAINNGFTPCSPKDRLVVFPWSLVWMSPKFSFRGTNCARRFPLNLVAHWGDPGPAKCWVFASVKDALSSGICH